MLIELPREAFSKDTQASALIRTQKDQNRTLRCPTPALQAGKQGDMREVFSSTSASSTHMERHPLPHLCRGLQAEGPSQCPPSMREGDMDKEVRMTKMLWKTGETEAQS